MKQLIKSVHGIAFKLKTKIRLYIFPKCPDPVPLPLSGESRFAPHAVPDPMTYPLEDNPYRYMVPRPVSEGSYRIYTSTISTDIALQTYSATIPLKVGIYESMPPYPATPATIPPAYLRTGKAVTATMQKKVLDRDHEKKRQYPVPSGSGGGSLSIEKLGAFPLPVLSFLRVF